METPQKTDMAVIDHFEGDTAVLLVGAGQRAMDMPHGRLSPVQGRLDLRPVVRCSFGHPTDRGLYATIGLTVLKLTLAPKPAIAAGSSWRQ
jgi:hypothetical protein